MCQDFSYGASATFACLALTGRQLTRHHGKEPRSRAASITSKDLRQANNFNQSLLVLFYSCYSYHMQGFLQRCCNALFMAAAGRGMDAPTVVAQILTASLDGCQGGIAAPGCFQRATPGM